MTAIGVCAPFKRKVAGIEVRGSKVPANPANRAKRCQHWLVQMQLWYLPGHQSLQLMNVTVDLHLPLQGVLCLECLACRGGHSSRIYRGPEPLKCDDGGPALV